MRRHRRLPSHLVHRCPRRHLRRRFPQYHRCRTLLQFPARRQFRLPPPTAVPACPEAPPVPVPPPPDPPSLSTKATPPQATNAPQARMRKEPAKTDERFMLMFLSDVRAFKARIIHGAEPCFRATNAAHHVPRQQQHDRSIPARSRPPNRRRGSAPHDRLTPVSTDSRRDHLCNLAGVARNFSQITADRIGVTHEEHAGGALVLRGTVNQRKPVTVEHIQVTENRFERRPVSGARNDGIGEPIADRRRTPPTMSRMWRPPAPGELGPA